MPQIFNDPAEFADALHQGRITECLETIEALDAQLEGEHPAEPARRGGPPRPAPRAPKAEHESPLARHARKCSICKHPDREAIEADFINWRSEDTICYEFSLSSRSSIYRHAAATGLLKRRRLNLRGVCERIIERAEEAPPSAASILRALRIFAHITEDGQWLEPPRRPIVTHIHVTSDNSQSPPHPQTCHPACPDEGREPSALTSRDGGEACPPRRGPAVSFSSQSGGPSIAVVAKGGNAPHFTETSPPPCEPASPREPASNQTFSPQIAPNFPCDNGLSADSTAEILIGTQNHSPGDSST